MATIHSKQIMLEILENGGSYHGDPVPAIIYKFYSPEQYEAYCKNINDDEDKQDDAGVSFAIFSDHKFDDIAQTWNGEYYEETAYVKNPVVLFANGELTAAGEEFIARQRGWWYVNVYLTNQQYGGPEEGGWWYDIGEAEESFKFTSEEESHIKRDELEAELKNPDAQFSNVGRLPTSSVNCDGWYEIRIQRHPARSYPDHTPHYC